MASLGVAIVRQYERGPAQILDTVRASSDFVDGEPVHLDPPKGPIR